MTGSSQSFHLFLHLPLELRQQVWHLTTLRPRLLIIQLVKTSSSFLPSHFLEMKDHPLDISCPTYTPPSLLHVCRESRAIGLQHYKLQFGNSPCPGFLIKQREEALKRGEGKPVRILRQEGVYVNYEMDTIVPSVAEDISLGLGWQYLPFCFQECKGIKKLAINAKLLAKCRESMPMWKQGWVSDWSSLVFGEEGGVCLWDEVEELFLYLEDHDVNLAGVRENVGLKLVALEEGKMDERSLYRVCGGYEYMLKAARKVVRLEDAVARKACETYVKWRDQNKGFKDSLMLLETEKI